MLARRFLYLIVILIVFVLAIGLTWTLMQGRLLRMTFVPKVAFAPLPDASAPDYTRPVAWLARPDLPRDPSRWVPAGIAPASDPRAAVFYLAPTTYLDRDHWNAPIDDRQSSDRLALFARGQASAFNGVGAVWAPRYRQATLGAFFAADDPRSVKAIDFAYRDIVRAFDHFLAAVPADRPIILAGHSQGSLHLLRLLRERVAGKPLARRIVAVYAAGWPISVTADLPALGLPPCGRADQAGCILAWQSFADPARPNQVEDYFALSKGPTGVSRKGSAMLCVNPLTGVAGGDAPAGANRGALVPQAGLDGASLSSGRIPARCTPEGILLIGPPPLGYGAFVLPGNNYHVFDYALFWTNIRDDAANRLKAFLAR